MMFIWLSMMIIEIEDNDLVDDHADRYDNDDDDLTKTQTNLKNDK